MAILAQPSATFEATTDPTTTGLTGTIGVRIIDGQGATTVARATAGIVESPAGSGIYTATLTAPSTEGQYVVVWDTGGASPSYANETLQVTQGTPTGLHALIGTRAAAGASVTSVSPVSQAQNITLVRGDDYDADDDRALVWNYTDSGTLDLTDATVTFTAISGSVTLTKAGTVVSATGNTKTVQVELASTETASLPAHSSAANQCYYDVQVTLAAGRKLTLWSGTVLVKEQVTG